MASAGSGASIARSTFCRRSAPGSLSVTDDAYFAACVHNPIDRNSQNHVVNLADIKEIEQIRLVMERASGKLSIIRTGR